MSDDFKGSIAQQYISFSAITEQNSVSGENFYSVALFMGHAESSALLVDVPEVGEVVELTNSTYAEMALGTLLADLVAFFSNNSLTKVFVICYDDTDVTTGAFPANSVTALTTQFNAFKHKGFFKLMTLRDNIPAHVALATLCDADTLLSQCWIPANDSGMVVEGSTTSMYAIAHAAGVDPVIIYHSNVAKNGALAQLGLMLGALNGSGTPVGNSTDYIGTDCIDASGASGANLPAASVTVLNNNHCGFWLTVGDGSGDVACRCPKTIKGNLPGASWVTKYINYMSSVEAAAYLTKLNRFRNNTTYRAILNIVVGYLATFSGIGRLSDAVLTAPAFKNLPSSQSDQIIVPEAWEATFNDGVRSVTVQGTLYI